MLSDNLDHAQENAVGVSLASTRRGSGTPMGACAEAPRCNENEWSPRTSTGVKGTLVIPADVVRHHPEIVDRALGIVLNQWGLGEVELRVRGDETPASTDLAGVAEASLSVAGYMFPCLLQEWSATAPASDAALS